jgi:hypothetical protein
MIPDPYIRAREGVDGLVAGFYLLRSAGRIDVPVRIWFGPPHDSETGEVLDRSPRWQLEIFGIDACDPDAPALVWGREVTDLSDVWPKAAKLPIDEVEYLFRVERAEWAEAHDPSDPFGTKYGRIDPLSCAMPSFD